MSQSMPPVALVIAPQARHDLLDLITWSADHFGESASLRYQSLLTQAFRDLQSDPLRLGSRPHLGEKLRSYHLRFSRDHVQGERVQRPRHFLIYRSAKEVLEILRVLHERRDLKPHLTSALRNN